MRRRRVKSKPLRGSHLPVLMRVVPITTGPVLELGCGIYSTHYLHWACYSSQRRLLTCENNPEYFDYIDQFSSESHEIKKVTGPWSEVDLSEPWSVAFVDHAPDDQRWQVIARLTHAEYVVAHDAEGRSDRAYKYSTIHHLFKYVWKYGGAYPHTAVYSNFHDLSNFKVV